MAIPSSTTEEKSPLLRRALKAVLRPAVDLALNLKGLRLTDDFSLTGRLLVLREGVERDILSVCQTVLREGMTVLDIGANVGLLTRHFARCVGSSGKVFAFEPGPKTYDALAFNTQRYPQVRTFQMALSDRDERTEFHLHPVSPAGNSLLNAHPAGETISVECLRLDTWTQREGMERIDVAKIDVEGAELLVLRGMRETIRRLPELRLIMEFCPSNLAASEGGGEAVLTELSSLGFGVQIIREDGSLKDVASSQAAIEPELPACGYVNLLCSKSSSAKPRAQ